MGKILEVFQENRNEIIKGLSQNLSAILHLLQTKGVFQEEQTHELLIADKYLAAYDIFYHVDAKGYYADFVDALTEARAYSVADFVKLAESSFTKELEDRNVEVIGSIVTLSCCLDEEYVVRWYKDEELIIPNDKFKVEDEGGEHQLIIADIQEEDSGFYSCKCGTTKTSCKLKVKDCSFTTKLEDTNVIGIGSDVTLSCCLDREYGVQWYKNKDELCQNHKFQFKSERGEHQLIIADIQEADSGVYFCRCRRTNTSCKLKVEDCSFTTTLKDINVIDIGSDVTLLCCLDKECGVQWYKDECEIFPKDNFKFKHDRFKHQLIIADIQEADSGVYSCQCGRTKTSCKLKVEDCSFTTKLEDRNVVDIGSDVTLLCCLDKVYPVRWYKDECEIFLNNKFKFKHEQFNHKLIIADIQEDDSGFYSCECGTAKTNCVLKVEDCSFTTKLEDRNVGDIGSNVTLSCCLDKEYGVQWYKDEKKIILNDKFKVEDERLEHQLIIADIQKEDSGVYSCQCGRTKTSCKLKVEANRFIRQLKDVTINEGERLILDCELDAECRNVKWFKTNGAISFRATTTDNKTAGRNAHRYKLDLNLVKMEDAGEYRCQNENAISTCNVTVKRTQEIQIDDSVSKTALLYELNSTKERLRVTTDELLHTKTELEKTKSDIKQQEISKREAETETAQLRTLFKEQEDMLKIKESELENKDNMLKIKESELENKDNMLKIKESELENKDNCIKELKVENQQLEVSVKKLESICKELESTRQQSAQMQEQIEKLEDEKQHFEGRVSSLESYINNGKINEQQQKANEQHQQVLEEIRTMMKEKKSKLCSVS